MRAEEVIWGGDTIAATVIVMVRTVSVFFKPSSELIPPLDEHTLLYMPPHSNPASRSLPTIPEHPERPYAYALRVTRGLPGHLIFKCMTTENLNLVWSRNADGVTINLPDKPPCDYAYVFKISSLRA